MQFLSKELVFSEFRQQLKRDLDRAIVCRFFVAYISKAGIESIGDPKRPRPGSYDELDEGDPVQGASSCPGGR